MSNKEEKSRAVKTRKRVNSAQTADATTLDNRKTARGTAPSRGQLVEPASNKLRKPVSFATVDDNSDLEKSVARIQTERDEIVNGGRN
jgi:hypothetical protein